MKKTIDDLIEESSTYSAYAPDTNCYSLENAYSAPLSTAATLASSGKFTMLGDILFAQSENSSARPLKNAEAFWGWAKKYFGGSLTNNTNPRELFAEVRALVAAKPKSTFAFPAETFIPFIDGILELKEKSEPYLRAAKDFECHYVVNFKFEDLPNVIYEKLSGFLQDISETVDDFKRLQQVVGSLILNNSSPGVVVFIGGNGGGRQLLFNLIESLFNAEAVSNLSISDMSKNFRLSHIIGKKLLISDFEENSKINETSVIKRIACNSNLNTDLKYDEAVDFSSTANLVIGCEKFPAFAEGDIFQIEESLTLVKLKSDFPVKRRAFNDFLNNAASFAGWALAGAYEYIENGYEYTITPSCSLSYQYRVFNDFIDECLIVCDSCNVFSRDVRAAFEKYIGERVVPKNMLHTLYKCINYKLGKSRTNVRIGDETNSGFAGLMLGGEINAGNSNYSYYR